MSVKEEQRLVFTSEVIEQIKAKNDDGYKISRFEKYWFANFPLVRKANLSFHMSDEELMEYARCKFGIDINGDLYTDKTTQIRKQSGIQYFAENYCKVKTEDGRTKNIKLRDYQNEITDMYIDNRFSILCSSRQSGKTITSSIVILYYCIFNNDKNIMIAANKKATTDEIVTKIKDIYYYLPFFLKPGVTNWNQSQITFGDTNCKVRSSTATKTAAIGFTVDFLFLDEFAHVPANNADDFYRSIFPTVSSINNSKIVITSTPNGYNLFWKLLSGAEKPVGDKEKNNFASKRVYWHQVPGRFINILRLDEYAMEKYNISDDDLYQWLFKMGFKEEELDERGFIKQQGIKFVTIQQSDKIVKEIHIPNRDEDIPIDIKSIIASKEWENPLTDYFRSLKYSKELISNTGEKRTVDIKLMDICEITSWKEDAIKDIGSLEAFNQEYDLQFLSGAKMVLDSQIMSKIENKLEEFEYVQIPTLDKRLFNPYDDLVWIRNRPDIFNFTDIKKYHICTAVDLAEGLGGDFSVLNIFRLMPKSIDEFPIIVKSIYDFFKLVQVGIYHNNRTSVEEIAELSYVLYFELFDPEKLGCVLELNHEGNLYTKTMQTIYNGRNNYGTHIFFRYKHRMDAPKKEIGIKLRSNKNLFIKEYQKRMKCGDIQIHNRLTLQEITKFIRKDTSTGYKFEADAGSHDDICMTIVELSSVFENSKFHGMVTDMFDSLDIKLKTEIMKRLENAPNVNALDYNMMGRAVNRANAINYVRNYGKNDNFTGY